MKTAEIVLLALIGLVLIANFVFTFLLPYDDGDDE